MKITPLRIRCAVCDKPVDDVLLDEDRVNFCYRIIVRCHGSRDEMIFTSSDVIRHGEEGWEALMGSEGLAFKYREAWRFGPYGE